MSTTDHDSDDPPQAAADHESNGDHPTADRRTLAAQVELLAEENRRLRTEYARARRSAYRRTALGLAVVGAVAVLGGLAFPDGRQVLFVLGATGLFGAALTAYLTPERFVAAHVGERVYAAAASNWAALATELGLRDEYRYLPGDETVPPQLFVPQRATDAVPDERSELVATGDDQRGLLLEPTGAGLYREFERALTGPVATEPAPLATQLVDGLVEQFELARSAETDVDPEGNRLTVAVETSAFGDVDRFDHPIASFVAVGVADGLDRPVELDVDPVDDGSGADWLVTCRWER